MLRAVWIRACRVGLKMRAMPPACPGELHALRYIGGVAIVPECPRLVRGIVTLFATAHGIVAKNVKTPPGKPGASGVRREAAGSSEKREAPPGKPGASEARGDAARHQAFPRDSVHAVPAVGKVTIKACHNGGSASPSASSSQPSSASKRQAANSRSSWSRSRHLPPRLGRVVRTA